MRIHFSLVCFLLIFANCLQAAPWVETDDVSLRADIQLLADTGLINVPVTTYPLMWASIAPYLQDADLAKYSQAQHNAFFRVKRALRFATASNTKNKLSLFTSKSTPRFTSFGFNQHSSKEAKLSSEFVGNDFAFKFQVNKREKNIQQQSSNKNNFDGSYYANKIGNWILRADAINKWWGPGLDTSLILSNNARPIPAISISRNNTDEFETPWLSWIGPWTFTAQIAHLEHKRFIADAKLWNSRATFKPFKKLEIGLAWSYQWGGKGQPESFQTFVDGLLGQTECFDGSSNCDEALLTKLGNQLAGFDARWGDSFYGIPYAIYAQTIGEDSPSPGTLQITDKAFLYGLETQFSIAQQRILLNFEYTDTQVSCASAEDTSQDCYYEHAIYRSGYRYRQRSIGSTYDNDAETIAITAVGRLINGDFWQVKIRKLKLNTNNRDLYPEDPFLGNSVSKVFETTDEVSIEYHKFFEKNKIVLGVSIQRSTFDTNSNDESHNESNYFIEYEYLF